MVCKELNDVVSACSDGCKLKCYIQPRSSRNNLTGIHDNALKIALTAPPVDGKANKALTQLLAELCGVPKSAIQITAGKSSRRKTVSISSCKREDIISSLATYLNLHSKT